MPDYDHLSLRLKISQLRAIEHAAGGLGRHHTALKKDVGDLPILAVQEAVDSLTTIRDRLRKEARRIIAPSPLGAWIDGTRGLGDGLVLVLGSMPALEVFEGPAAVWKYNGLHVVDGRAPQKTGGEKLGFDPELKSYALQRVADPVMKVGGPYRRVYDDRRAHTEGTHPPMWTEGNAELVHPSCEGCQAAADAEAKKDCSHYGGPHWSNGHRHSDAIRVTAKAILRDAWRIAHGFGPRVDQMTEDHDVPEAA